MLSHLAGMDVNDADRDVADVEPLGKSTMTKRMLFVDLENIQKIDASQLRIHTHVMVFYGAAQVKLRKQLEQQSRPAEQSWTWIKISGQGRNALDFHIAYYLGQILSADPTVACAIVSGDSGFDPLVRHVGLLGCACQRVKAAGDAFPLTRERTSDDFGRFLKLLRKEKVRPVKRRSLSGKVKSWFPELTEGERSALMQRLFAERGVYEEDHRLVYDL